MQLPEINNNSSVRSLRNVGDRRAELLGKLGIYTVSDLLRNYPRAYEDWSAVVPIDEAPLHQTCCIKATALHAPSEHPIRKGMTLYKFTVTDGTATMKITLFNNRYVAKTIRTNETYLFFGTVTGNFTKYEMAAPMIEPAEGKQRIRPIYRQTEGLTSRIIEELVSQAFAAKGCAPDTDPLPEELRNKHSLCTRRFAIENIHFPDNAAAIDIARRRLIFEELLVLQLGFLQLKGRTKGHNAAIMATDFTAEYVKLLAFTPTGAQNRAIADCIGDMQGHHPMSRLIQGDVGSGKTAVAAAAAYTAAKNGYQTALMAPTEILAEQHYRSLSSLLSAGGVRVALLTGSMPAAAKRECVNLLAAGEIDVIAGTHALISSNVEFKLLGLVITDEQHRFGVAQRAALACKGDTPHTLVMSATPIPRTLALIVYGDLDVSVLDELPPGRQPIETYHINSGKRARAYEYVKKHINDGRQAYIVCPLVEDTEQESDLASATEYAEKLSTGVFSGYSLGLLHGRMKGVDKERIMTGFSAGNIQILVSTTVIEVGVDVPNSVIMVIENAERFGLAQLHQLRGRVGRGAYRSTCILISDAETDEANRRLKIMCETNDGFKIADEDLKLRGPGDFFGNRQHGLPDLRIANLIEDSSLMIEAQESAKKLLNGDPRLSLPEHAALADEVRLLFEHVGEHGLN